MCQDTTVSVFTRTASSEKGLCDLYNCLCRVEQLLFSNVENNYERLKTTTHLLWNFNLNSPKCERPASLTISLLDRDDKYVTIFACFNSFKKPVVAIVDSNLCLPKLSESKQQ